ncbi:MAG: BamA/TamA family outer membrane protein [Pseudomonadota bacterium]
MSLFCATVIMLAMALHGPLRAQSVSLNPSDDELAERLSAEALVFATEEGATPGDIIATAKGDYGRLVALLYEEGYFGASVSIRLAGREAATLSAFDAPATLAPVEIDVDLGSRFTFGRADIAPLAPGAMTPEGFKPGARAGTAVINEAARGAVQDWRNASHAKAEITGQEVVAWHRASELDVVLSVDPGPSLTFGELILPPDSTVRGRRLTRIAGLPTGEPYSPAALTQARARLVRTGVFSSVVLREADTPNPDGTLDIELAVEPAPPRRIGFGAEIDSANGLSLEAFWLHRNIFGGGQRLRFDAEIEGLGATSGGIDYALGLSLRTPAFRRSDDTLEVGIRLERLDESAFTESLLELGARAERQVNETTLIGTGIGLRFSDISDDFGSRTMSHVVLVFDGERDRRDDTLNPRGGSYGFLEIRPFIGIGDSETGLRLEGDFRRYLALGDSTTIAARSLFGSVIGTEIDDTPPDYLFFSGGGGTVRGQGFQSLSIEEGGDESGGRSFAGLSLELRQDVTDALGVVGFVDYGFLSADSDWSDGEDHVGAGLGLRYNTALGPLRVDVGVPVGTASDGTEYGIYIGLGQSF